MTATYRCSNNACQLVHEGNPRYAPPCPSCGAPSCRILEAPNTERVPGEQRPKGAMER